MSAGSLPARIAARRGARLVLAVLLLGGIAVAWYAALWAPRAQAIAAARADAASAARHGDQLRAELAALSSAAKLVPAKQAELGRLQDAVPPAADLAQLIVDVDQAAATSGESLVTLSPSKPEGAQSATGAAGAPGPGAAKSGLTAIQLSITGSGTYVQAMRFLDALETLPRLLALDDVSLTAAGRAASGASPPLTMSVSARAFTTAPASAATS